MSLASARPVPSQCMQGGCHWMGSDQASPSQQEGGGMRELGGGEDGEYASQYISQFIVSLSQQFHLQAAKFLNNRPIPRVYMKRILSTY